MSSRREFLELTAKVAALQAAAGLPKLPASDGWLDRFDHVVCGGEGRGEGAAHATSGSPLFGERGSRGSLSIPPESGA